MFQRFIHPGYLSHRLSREIKEMYFSKAVADFAQAAMMLFEPVYMVSILNFSLRQVLMFYIAVYVLYWLLIPFGAKIAARKGYEHSIFYSTFFQVLYWAFLFGSQHTPLLIFFAPLMYAWQKSLFWPAFHSDMARFSNQDQRGRENSGLYALISLVYIIGPFIGGWILQDMGFRALFALVSILTIGSVIPLFTTIEQFIPKPYLYTDSWKLFRNFPGQAMGYVGYGEELVQLVVWPIFIYMTVPDYFKFGTIISISTLIATLVMLYVGVLTDLSGKRVLIRYFSSLNGLFWAIRPFFPAVTGLLATNTLGTITKNSLTIPVAAMTYDRANETHILPYCVFYEQALSIGKILICVLILVATLFSSGFVAAFTLAGLFSLLYSKLK
ncbi:MAG: MFS transporter [Candidatus Saccharibacteria bacterium]